jgi:cytochrome c oxidase cbb3-type subunit 3
MRARVHVGITPGSEALRRALRAGEQRNQREQYNGMKQTSHSAWVSFIILSKIGATMRACALLFPGLLFALAASGSQAPKVAPQSETAAMISQGEALFQQQCAFCHGRDAGGGETGPDLTRSKLVAEDASGNKIGVVVRNGRPQQGMPPFNMTDPQIAAIAAFIHAQKAKADTQQGGRRGVDPSDLQTGNVDEGKKYFNGAGGCSGCHSPTGDLAGVAKRYQGLKLEERLLYPTGAPSKLTVTLPSGETVTGTLVYRDEFTVGLRDSSGWYRAWQTKDVKYKVDAPVEAHVELLGKYTDDDIHNLMAYLQTLH